MKQAFLFALIIFNSAIMSCENFDVKKIAGEAKKKFSEFMSNDKNIQFELIESSHTSEMIYKKKNLVIIQKWTSALSPDLKTKQKMGRLYYDDTVGEKFGLSKEYPVQFIKQDNFNPLGGSFYIIFQDWWNLDLSTARIERIEWLGSRECYIIKFDKLAMASYIKEYRLWVDMKALVVIKEELKCVETKDITEIKYVDFRKIADTREIAFVFEHYNNRKLSYKENINYIGVVPAFPDYLLLKEVDAYITGIKQKK